MKAQLVFLLLFVHLGVATGSYAGRCSELRVTASCYYLRLLEALKSNYRGIPVDDPYEISVIHLEPEKVTNNLNWLMTNNRHHAVAKLLKSLPEIPSNYTPKYTFPYYNCSTTDATPHYPYDIASATPDYSLREYYPCFHNLNHDSSTSRPAKILLENIWPTMKAVQIDNTGSKSSTFNFFFYSFNFPCENSLKIIYKFLSENRQLNVFFAYTSALANDESKLGELRKMIGSRGEVIKIAKQNIVNVKKSENHTSLQCPIGSIEPVEDHMCDVTASSYQLSTVTLTRSFATGKVRWEWYNLPKNVNIRFNSYDYYEYQKPENQSYGIHDSDSDATGDLTVYSNADEEVMRSSQFSILFGFRYFYLNISTSSPVKRMWSYFEDVNIRVYLELDIRYHLNDLIVLQTIDQIGTETHIAHINVSDSNCIGLATRPYFYHQQFNNISMYYPSIANGFRLKYLQYDNGNYLWNDVIHDNASPVWTPKTMAISESMWRKSNGNN